MTREELIKAHKEGVDLINEINREYEAGKLSPIEYMLLLPWLHNLRSKLPILLNRINSMNQIDYSIAKCDCCDEEYILETHISSKGEIIEEKPFDFTDKTPAELFKMGFDACLNRSKHERKD